MTERIIGATALFAAQLASFCVAVAVILAALISVWMICDGVVMMIIHILE